MMSDSDGKIIFQLLEYKMMTTLEIELFQKNLIYV